MKCNNSFLPLCVTSYVNDPKTSILRNMFSVTNLMISNFPKLIKKDDTINLPNVNFQSAAFQKSQSQFNLLAFLSEET